MIKNSSEAHKVLAFSCTRKMLKVRKADYNKAMQTLHFYKILAIENLTSFKIKINVFTF